MLKNIVILAFKTFLDTHLTRRVLLLHHRWIFIVPFNNKAIQGALCKT